jgi:arylsulfatase
MNVALVVLDTLRYDAFEEHFDWLSGVRFTNAWAPSHWTVPVHASLFAGKYPSELGVHVDNQALDCPEPVIAELLNDAGYTTRAFASNIILARPFDFDRGFAEYTGTWTFRALSGDVFDWESFAEEDDDGPDTYLGAARECIVGEYDTWPSLQRGARVALRDLGGGRFGSTRSGGDPLDEQGSQQALDYVRGTDFGGREFLFVNLMDAHMPHTPPEAYRTTDTDEPISDVTEYNGLVATAGDGPDADVEVLMQAYDDSVRYLADVYREIHAELREEFDVVITLSDHGELFGEHGVWQHSYGVYPELTHVPCVISGDRIENAARAETVSLLDVHRTVLDLAGVDGDSAGNMLLDVPDDASKKVTIAPSDRTCAAEYLGPNPRNREKIERLGYDPARFDEELFGVAADGAYGYETTDGLRVLGETNLALDELLEAHRDRIDRRDTRDRTAVSDATRRHLEDLGYA